MKTRIIDRAVSYYYEILFLAINIWLGLLLISVGHSYIALMILGLVIAKGVSILCNYGPAKTTTLTLLNTMWAFNTFYFWSGRHPIDLPYQLPFIIFLLGVGIALRGRYDE